VGGSTLKRELIGIALLLFAIFLAGALATLGYAALRSGSDVVFGDAVQAGVVVRSTVGGLGWYLARPLVMLVGWPAAALVPLAPAAHALRLFGRLESDVDRSWLIFLGGMAVLLPIAVGLAVAPPAGTSSALSGVWGSFVAFYWRSWFGGFGAWVVLLLALSVLTAATLAWNPIRMVVGPAQKDDRRAMGEGHAAELAAAPIAVEANGKRKRRSKKDVPDGTSSDVATLLAPTPEEMPAIDPSLLADAGDVDDELPKERRKKEKKSKSEVAAERDETIAAQIFATAGAVDGASDELPPTDLLSKAPEKNVDVGRRELDAMGTKLMEALRTFRVEGELVGRTTGPTVTQYEIEPAPGVKVRQFANLSNDLALAMRAPSIRVVAPIPGRGAVGVEVPNPTAEMVGFRELIEARDFQGARAALPIALGRDLEGKPVVADLAKMPHLLIAGATGSGKSVCVNTLITSLVYRHTPKTLRFLMVDPKMVELSVYNHLPHLRHKVVTDNRDAAAVLKWAVMEMQERYELLAANGARNIQDFNRKVQEGGKLKLPKRPDRHHRRARGPHDDGAGGGRDPAGDARAEGARDRHPPDPRHAAPERERHHGPHQGELPEPDRVPRRVADRQPHDHRRHGCRVAPRQWRHAVHPTGEVRAVALAGGVHLERGHGASHRVVSGAARSAAGGARGAGSRRRGAGIVGAGHSGGGACARSARGGVRRPRGRRRCGAGQAVPRSGGGGDPAPAGLDVAPAAPPQGGLRPRGTDHRPASQRGRPRAAGWVEATRCAGGTRRDRADLRPACLATPPGARTRLPSSVSA
jgi:DNA translocase FtsK/SpoIIIE-like protein